MKTKPNRKCAGQNPMRIMICLFFLTAAVRAETQEFFFRDGDRVAIVGDSITEPSSSNAAFLEAYTLARFPNWKISFRNLGWSGDTSAYSQRQQIASLNSIAAASQSEREDLVGRAVKAGLDRDVLPLNPTAVTINFGMNDGGWGAVDPKKYEAYLACQTASARQLAAAGARVAFITPKPVERTAKPGDLEGNKSLAKFSAGLSEVAQSTGARYANAFQPLLDLLVAGHEKQPNISLTGGDGVHPDPAGNLIVSWAFLKALGATGDVSSATVDAVAQRVTRFENCKVDQVANVDGVVKFTRLDDRLPIPVPAESVKALDAAPILNDLSRYLLTVTGLEAPRYALIIDGVKADEFTREQLAAGINMTGLPGPVTTQTQALFKKIADKNQAFTSRWRSVQIFQITPPTWLKTSLRLDPESSVALEKARTEELSRCDLQIASMEKEIELLRQNKPHSYELQPLPSK
jgi:lysophospholipase L1-like esterase